MDPYDAKEAAAAWVRLAGWERGDPHGFDKTHRGDARAEGAMIEELTARVPDSSTVQVVVDSQTNARVISVDPGTRLLREIGFSPIELGPDDQPTIPPDSAIRVSTRIIVLDPLAARCSTETFWTGRIRERWRKTRWTFEFGDQRLAFTTEEAEGPGELEDEQIVQAIFDALGWGSPVAEQLRAGD